MKQSHVNMGFLFLAFVFARNEAISRRHEKIFFPLLGCFCLFNSLHHIDYQLFENIFCLEIFFPLFFQLVTFGLRFGLFGYLFVGFNFLFLMVIN